MTVTKETGSAAGKGGAATAVQPALSGKQLADSRYKALVETVVALCHRFSGLSLQFYWDMGVEASKLIRVPGEYGNRKVDTFCKDIEERTSLQFSTNSVYKAASFSQAVTPAQLETLKRNNVSWRVAARVTSSRLSPEEQQKLLVDICDGKVPRNSVNEAVGERTARSTGTEPRVNNLKILRGVPEVLSLLRSKVKGFGTAAKDIFRGDSEEEMRKAAEYVTDAKEEFDVLVAQLTRDFQTATEAMAKVAAVLKKKK